LYSLSHDAIPPLIAQFTDPTTPNDIKDNIGGLLACRLIELDPPEDQPWYATHYSRTQAATLLKAQEDRLMNYLVFEESDWFVEVNDTRIPCADYGHYERNLD
jgi:hypothetical protein